MAEEEDGKVGDQDSVKKCTEACLTAQAMIDINAEHLESLRTQCFTSSELTQNEIRGLESKLIKLFGRQLVAKTTSLSSYNVPDLKMYPNLSQWFRVVGFSSESIEALCKKFNSFDELLSLSEAQLKSILRENDTLDEEIRRLLTALRNLKSSIELLMQGELPSDLDLHWDSWNKNIIELSHSSGSISTRGSSPRINHRTRVTRASVPSEELIKSSPLSPPQSAELLSCPWSSVFGSFKESCGSPISNSMPVRDRKQTPPATPTLNKKATDRKFPTTPPPSKKLQTNLLLDPFPLTKSKSHEEHLAHKIEPLESLQANNFVKKYINKVDYHHNSYDSLPHQHRRRLATEPGLSHTSPISTSPSRSPPVISPDQQDNCFDEPYLPVPPRSPRTHGGMVHVIHHRFSTTVKMTPVTCRLCDKPMFIGYKCRECKYRCHRDCVDKVPPSCGLSNELVDVFRRTIISGGRHSPNIPVTLNSPGFTSPNSVKSEGFCRDRNRKSKGYHGKPIVNISSFTGPDSSSNTSSCNSSTPSSPALIITTTHTPPASASKIQSFQFPDIACYSNSDSILERTIKESLITSTKSKVDNEIIDTQKSNDSDKTVSGTSGSTDSEKTIAGRLDSQDSQLSDLDANERSWPRQNSLTLREWDIPYDQLKIEEELGNGRFGTVFRGNWHGHVAIKRLNMNNAVDDRKAIEAFKQEVATFRKTRHENLVLFMGACMKPPHLAIVTSLCKGMTLYTHIHIRKDKFNVSRTIGIAHQIAQGMGYLHARGIIHKDLKTKNIFYENGKIVITDFGLFLVTKLFHGNRKGNWLTVPKGWLCYLAPEIIKSLTTTNEQDTDELPFSMSADMFAFGTVWYELLIGEWPFRGQPPEVIIWQVGKGMKQSLTNVQASKEIKELLMLCWSYSSAERPGFIKALDLLIKLPKKRLQRSPSHPVHLLRSAESIF